MKIVMLSVHDDPIPGITVVNYKPFLKLSETKKKNAILKATKGADIVFIQLQRPGWISNNILKKINGFTIVWTGDVREGLKDWQIKTAEAVDLMTFVSYDYVKQCVKLGITANYFDIWYDQKIFKPKKIKKIYDIVFTGTDYKGFELSEYRQEVVQFLKDNYGNDFLCLGRGWQGNSDGENASDLPDQCKIYNQSKIAINVSNYKQSGYSSDRILRAMGSGCFVLTHHYPNMPYGDGTHLRVFHTFDELIVLCEYYLVFEKKREDIAKRGHELVGFRSSKLQVKQRILILYEQNRNSRHRH